MRHLEQDKMRYVYIFIQDLDLNPVFQISVIEKKKKCFEFLLLR